MGQPSEAAALHFGIGCTATGPGHGWAGPPTAATSFHSGRAVWPDLLPPGRFCLSRGLLFFSRESS